MSELIWEEAPSLHRPILVTAFEGWFDAGECATGAVRLLRNKPGARRVARIDPEVFFDFQESRPEIELSGGERIITWPENDCYAVEVPEHHDVVLLSGIEPRMRWRTFCESIVELAADTGCEMVVTLGAMVAGVPHTRPSTVQGSAANPELATRLGLDRPTYQGPTGIVGALHDALDRASLPVISLRVGVPHYVAGPPNPKGTMALLKRFEQVTGVPTGHADLETSVIEWEERVSEAVSHDPEVNSYVTQLEREADRVAEEQLPTGDDLAAEFQKFLKEQRDDD